MIKNEGKGAGEVGSNLDSSQKEPRQASKARLGFGNLQGTQSNKDL